jgi:UDP-3-O-[3-hydroxymyristoyl] glucosamine N-acyltransferase
VIDPRFFSALGPVPASAVAAAVGAAVFGNGERPVMSIAPLDEAGTDDLAFCQGTPKVGRIVTSAGVCLVPEGAARLLPDGTVGLEVVSPRAVLARAAALLVAVRELEPGAPSLHPLARLEEGVRVMPGAVIGAHAEIGAGTTIGANAVVGPGVAIGRGCTIGNGASIQCALIGDRVKIGANSVIGESGFGIASGPDGLADVPQLGRVVIQDDVTMGGPVAVDRAAFGDTVIGLASKLDNFTHVGHNSRLGRGVIIAAFGGISGTCDIGDFVLMGGRVGLGDHLTVGAGAKIGAGSGVLSSVPAGETWQGYPAQSAGRWRREQVLLRRMTEPKKST